MYFVSILCLQIQIIILGNLVICNRVSVCRYPCVSNKHGTSSNGSGSSAIYLADYIGLINGILIIKMNISPWRMIVNTARNRFHDGHDNINTRNNFGDAGNVFTLWQVIYVHFSIIVRYYRNWFSMYIIPIQNSGRYTN